MHFKFYLLMPLSLTSQGQVKIFHIYMKAGKKKKKNHAPREWQGQNVSTSEWGFPPVWFRRKHTHIHGKNAADLSIKTTRTKPNQMQELPHIRGFLEFWLRLLIYQFKASLNQNSKNFQALLLHQHSSQTHKDDLHFFWTLTPEITHCYQLNAHTHFPCRILSTEQRLSKKLAIYIILLSFTPSWEKGSQYQHLIFISKHRARLLVSSVTFRQ